jgi:hypothetical protein
LPGALGKEEQRVTANGYRVSFRTNENILKLDSGDSHTLCNYTKKHCIAYFKGIVFKTYKLYVNTAFIFKKRK